MPNVSQRERKILHPKGRRLLYAIKMGTDAYSEPMVNLALAVNGVGLKDSG